MSSFSKRYIVIMAGGSGTRMGSHLPKQLHIVGNNPMMIHLLDNACSIDACVVLIVSAKNKDIIINTLTSEGYIKYVSDTEYSYMNTIIHICIQPIADGTGG